MSVTHLAGVSGAAPPDGPLFENLPPELTALDRWCPWRFQSRRPGEAAAKIAFDLRTGGYAKSNNPATWSSFDAAVEAYRRGGYRSVSFALGDDAPYCGLDLDDCRDAAQGVVASAAMDIVRRFDTYAEVSQSGRGVKLILRGVMPTDDGGGKNRRTTGGTWATGGGPVELYRRGRFFCLTGWRVTGAPAAIADRTAELRALYTELYPVPVLRRVYPAPALDVGERERAQRCARYVRRMPASVAGRRGHDRLLSAACACVRFGLGDAAALAALAEFNARCDPIWPEKDVERKLREARKLVPASQVGALPVDRRPSPPARRPSRRVVLLGRGDA